MNDFIINRGETILEHCQHTLKMYEDWNDEINKAHEQNRLLFIHPVTIHEPKEVPRTRKSRYSQKDNTETTKAIDPLEVTLEQVNCEFKYNQNAEPTAEEVEFRRTHTFKFYKDRRNHTKPDPNIDVNIIRYRGPDETSGRMTRIPNTSSVIGTPQSYKNGDLRRKIQIRKKTLQNSQSSLKSKYVKVPHDIRVTGYQPDPREKAPDFHFCTLECEEIELKIKKTQKEIENNLKRAERTVRKIQDQFVAAEPMYTSISSIRSPRRFRSNHIH